MMESQQELTTTSEQEATLLTLQDVLARNEFSENDRLLEQEIEELESLYKMSKGILQNEANPNGDSTSPKRLGTNGAAVKRSMLFIAQQTGNLINIRRLKMDIIRQKADLKRDELDRNIKALVQIAKEGRMDNDESSPKKVLEFLVNHLNISLPMLSPHSKSIQSEEDVDAALDALLDGDGIDTEFTEELPKTSALNRMKDYGTDYDGKGNFLVYSSSEEKLWLVDSDYEVICELDDGEYDADILDDGRLIDRRKNVLIEIID
jgi:hypothetical protein